MTGLDPGSEFAGHRIEGLIGRGGMGEVYRALHLHLERPVALKVVAPTLAEEEAVHERFRRECRLAASVDHPAAIPIFEAGEHEGRLYVTMRLVLGPDLGRQVRGAGPLAPEWAAELAARVAEALDAAHARGLVHRDVKPANLLLEPAGEDVRVFIGDFGLAKLLDDTTGPTRTGTWLGTVDYAAPEALEGGPAGPAADVYGLGGVLYTALTGRAPYVRDTLSGVMWAHAHDPPPSLGELEHPATEALDAAIRRAMAKDPGERFGTGAELATALRDAVRNGERPPLALAPSIAASAEAATSADTRPAGAADASTPQLPASQSLWRRRRAAVLGAAVAVLIALVAVVVLATRGGGSPNRVSVELVPVPGVSQDVEMSGNTVWLAQGTNAVPVDDGKAGTPLRLGSEPKDLAADADNLWVALDDGLARIDSHTRRPVGGPIPVTTSDGSRVAVGEGGVWLSDPFEDTIVRIDPETSRPAIAPIKIPAGVDGSIAAGEGAIWVLSADISDNAGISVTPVDPHSGRPGAPIHVGAYGEPRTLAVGEGSVWVSDPKRNAVRRIDARTRKLSPTPIPLTSGATDMVLSGAALFALDGEGETLLRIDAKTGKPVGLPVPVAAGEGSRITAGHGAVWVASSERRRLLRLAW